nr:MAG TPA: hypothetical protein [Caudoviricetes sp.]
MREGLLIGRMRPARPFAVGKYPLSRACANIITNYQSI